MKIIVVGIGKVGYTVAEQLSAEKHDIVVVDTNNTVLDNIMSSLDVIGVSGSGAVKRVLSDAGVEDSDLLIALTGSDEINLLCCLLARKMGAKSTIARVRNPEYSEQFELIREDLGLSMAVNPEREAAGEIMRILRFPSAMNIDTFAKGKIDLVSFIANHRCTLCGQEIKHSFAGIQSKVLICAVERGDSVFIPSGDFIIKENDMVMALAAPQEIAGFFTEIGMHSDNVKKTMIIGGGRIARYLAPELERMRMNTTIIEKDMKAAENISLAFPHANVICGDGTNCSLLLEEGLRGMDVVCCLTGFDEENVLLSLYAKSVVPGVKAITKVNRISFQDVLRSLDVGSIINPKDTTVDLILQHVRARENKIGSRVEQLYKLINNKAEALEFHVSEGSALADRPLHDLKLRRNVLIGSVDRDGEVFVPHGKDALRAGDSVIVVTTIQGLSDLDDIRG